MDSLDLLKLSDSELLKYADELFEKQKKDAVWLSCLKVEDPETDMLVRNILEDVSTQLPKTSVTMINYNTLKTIELAKKCISILKATYDIEVRKDIVTTLGVSEFVYILKTDYISFGKSGDALDRMITLLMTKVDHVDCVMCEDEDDSWMEIALGINDVFKSI